MMMSKKAALEWNINQLVNQQAATLHSSAAYILLHIIAAAALVARAACTLKQGPLNIWTEHSNFQIHSRGTQKPL